MQECNHVGCDGATVCRGAREVEGNQLAEKYECEFSHTFHETIEL